MCQKIIKLAIVLLVIIMSGFLVGQDVQAEAGSVVISEIAWMGGVESANDEWIELANKTDQSIDLDGWRLAAVDGSPDISLTGTIPAQGFFLLERSDDDSVLGVVADLIYTGSLGNSGETLELFDDDDNLVDRVEAIDAWPAGDNESKETMQLSDTGWLTAAPTPKQETSDRGQATGDQQPGTSDQQLETSNQRQETGSQQSGVGVAIPKREKIIINEVYPNPVGSDRQKEFIELYNAGNVSVDLSGWRVEVDDRVYVFGKLDELFEIQRNIILRPGGYLALMRSFSNLVLNNEASTIRLFKPDKKTAEQTVKYKNAPEGYSFVNSAEIDLQTIATSTKKFFLNSPLPDQWVWSSLISPGANNQIKALNTAPQAFFSMPEQIKEKEEVFFDSSDTVDEEGDDLKYTWDFDDGVEVSLPEVSHTFLEAGEYEVSLKVTDGQEESLFSRIVKVAAAAGSEPAISAEEEEEGSDTSYWYEELERDTYPLLDYNRNSSLESSSLPMVSLGELANYPLGTLARVQAVVVAVPGVLATQAFYVADNEAGFKIYNYKKDFPPLAEGDLVEIEGELVELRDELTLKVEDSSKISLIKAGLEVEATLATARDLVALNLAKLVEVEGEIVDKKSPRIYLADDAGEIVIYLKPGTEISSASFTEQDKFSVKGIVGLVSGEIVLLPRGESDIAALEPVEQGEVLGESDEVLEWDLDTDSKQANKQKYWIVIFSALGLLALVYYLKKHNK